MAELEALCNRLPAQEQAERKIRELREYQEQWHSVQMELALLPGKPECPPAPKPFAGMKLEQARQMVSEDAQNYTALQRKKPGILLVLGAVLCLLLGVYMAFTGKYLYLAGVAVLALLFLGIGIRAGNKNRRAMAALEEKSDHL